MASKWQEAMEQEYGGTRRQNQAAASPTGSTGKQTVSALNPVQNTAPMSTQAALAKLQAAADAARAAAQNTARYSLGATAPRMVTLDDAYDADVAQRSARVNGPMTARAAAYDTLGSYDVRGSAATVKALPAITNKQLSSSGITAPGTPALSAQEEALARLTGAFGQIGQNIAGAARNVFVAPAARVAGDVSRQLAERLGGNAARYIDEHPNGRATVNDPEITNRVREAMMARVDYEGNPANQMTEDQKIDAMNGYEEWLRGFSRPEELGAYYDDGGVNPITGTRKNERAEMEYLQAMLDRINAENAPVATPEQGMIVDSKTGDKDTDYHIVNGQPVRGEDYQYLLWQLGAGKVAEADAANRARQQAIDEAQAAEEAAREAVRMGMGNYLNGGEYERLVQEEEAATQAAQRAGAEVYISGLEQARAKDTQADKYKLGWYNSLQYNPDFGMNSGNAQGTGAALMQAFEGRGNVDLMNRPQISAEQLTRAGWDDAGEGAATVYTSTYSAGDTSQGYDFEHPTNIIINATPIRADGSVLSPEELERYLEKISYRLDPVEADKPENGGMGLIISVDNVTGDLDTAYQKASDDMQRLHQAQAMYYDQGEYTTRANLQQATSAPGTLIRDEARQQEDREQQRRAAMTEEEKRTEMYVRNTMGDAEAEEYLSLLAPDLDARIMGEQTQAWQTYGEEHPYAGMLQRALANLIGGVEGGRYTLGQIVGNIGNNSYRNAEDQGLTFDRNNPAYEGQEAAQAYMHGALTNFAGHPVQSKLYQIGTSMLDNALRNVTMGRAGEFVMGLGAMSQTTADVYDQTGDVGKASIMGIADGLIEMVTEHMGYDNLMERFVINKKGTLAEIIQDLVRTMGSEFGEETTGAALGQIVDAITMGDESEWTRTYNRYMDETHNEGTAAYLALNDVLVDVLTQGLEGAASGVGMAGATATATYGTEALYNAVADAVAETDVERMSQDYGDAASTFINNYKGDMLPQAYREAFEVFFGAGEEGRTLQEAQAEMQKIAPDLEQQFDGAQQYAMWAAGTNARQDAADRAEAKQEKADVRAQEAEERADIGKRTETAQGIASREQAAGFDQAAQDIESRNMLAEKAARQAQQAQQRAEAAREQRQAAADQAEARQEKADARAQVAEERADIGKRTEAAERIAAREQLHRVVEQTRERMEQARKRVDDLNEKLIGLTGKAKQDMSEVWREAYNEWHYAQRDLKAAQAREQAAGFDEAAQDIEDRNLMAEKAARQAQQAQQRAEAAREQRQAAADQAEARQEKADVRAQEAEERADIGKRTEAAQGIAAREQAAGFDQAAQDIEARNMLAERDAKRQAAQDAREQLRKAEEEARIAEARAQGEGEAELGEQVSKAQQLAELAAARTRVREAQEAARQAEEEARVAEARAQAAGFDQQAQSIEDRNMMAGKAARQAQQAQARAEEARAERQAAAERQEALDEKRAARTAEQENRAGAEAQAEAARGIAARENEEGFQKAKGEIEADHFMAEKQTRQQRQAEERWQRQTEAERQAARYDSSTVTPGVVRQYNAANTTRFQKVAFAEIDALAKAYGVEVDVVDSLENGRANGKYVGGKRIVIALDAANKAYLQVFGHELTHYVREMNQKFYNVLERAAIEALGEDESFDLADAVQKRVEEYRNAGQELDPDEAFEEIVAETVGTVFTDQKATQMFMERISQNRTLAQKVVDFVKAFVNKLRSIAGQYAKDQNRPEVAAMLKHADQLEDMAVILDEALAQINEGAQETAEGQAEAQAAASVKDTGIELQPRTKYSEKTNDLIDGYINAVNNNILSMAQKYRDDKNAAFSHYDMGNVKEKEAEEIRSLLGMDVNGFKHQIDKNAFIHIEKRHGINGKADHSMANLNDIARIEWVIENYDSIERTVKKDGTLDYSYNYMDRNNNPAPKITYSKRINGTYYVIEAAANNSSKRLHVVSAYIDKNGAAQVSDANTPDYTSDNAHASAPDNSKSQNAGDVNTQGKYSLKTNTDAFKRWFGDSKVVDEDGNPLVVYHGTDEKFTVFDMDKGRSTMDIQGAFFSPWEIDAGSYGGNVGAYYLSLQNPAPESVGYAALRRFQGQNEAGKKAREYLISKGYDGVNNEGEEYIAFYPYQIKSATNNKGTFDRNNPDVRFSLNNTSAHDVNTDKVLKGVDGRPAIRITGGANAAQNSQAQTKAALDVAEAREAATSEQEKAAQKTAKRLLKDYKSTYDLNDLTANLMALYDEIARNGQSEATLGEAAKLARAIIEKSRDIDNAWAQEYADLKRRLKNARVTLTEQQRQEAANIAGSYGAYRQSMFGFINLVKEGGTPMDSLWQELAEQYPEFFPADTQEGDMMEVLANVSQRLKPHYSNPYGMDIDAASTDLAMQMHAQAWDQVGDTKKAQAMRDAIQELRNQWHEAVDQEIRIQFARRRQAFNEVAQALHDARESGDELAARRAMKKYRAELAHVQAERAEAEAALSYRQHYEDQEARAQAMKHITQTVERLTKMLARPDKNKHIPTAMQPFVHGLLEAVTGKMKDSQKTRQFASNLSALRNYLASQLNMQQGIIRWDDEHAGSWMALTEDMINQLDQSIQTVQSANRPLFTMTLKQLQTFSKALQNIHHLIATNNQMWTDERHESMDKVGGDTIDELTGKRTNMAQADEKSVRAAVDRFLNLDQLDARSFFARLGKSALKIYDALQAGQSKAYARIREASEDVPAILGIDGKGRRQRVKELRQWAKDMHEFTIPGIDRNGPRQDTLKLTTRELMELYALSRRQQGRQHILTGGIQIGDSKRGAEHRSYKFDEAMLDSMLNTLTPEQKRIVERMQEYLSHTVSEWGNEVTEQMYLYRMFGEDNYWPIQSSRDFLATKERDGQFMFNALVNMGFTKNLQEMARNPVVIRDAVETFAGHISEMATFSGLAMPMDDLLRWYNYAARDENGNVAYTDSVKGQIARTMGNAGRKYVQNLIDNINGMGDSAMVSDVAKDLMGKYKRAAILANLRVVVQQPTAILRASAMINPKYLTAAARGIGKNTIKEMQEHSALAWWKGNGNYEIGTGKSMMSTITGMEEDWRGDFEEKAGSLAGKADDLGWATIWQAVKAETRAKHKDMQVGSDAYWNAVVERFEDVCMQTQVVDTVLSRSQAMRSKDAYMKMITAFMSEPTKNYNLIRTALGDWYDAMSRKDATARHRAGGKLIRSGLAIATATAANAVMTAAFDALRYYNPDEEDEWGEKIGAWNAWWNKFWANFQGDLVSGLNPLENIPLVKDIWQIAMGEDVERMDMSMVTKLVKAVDRLIKYQQGNANGYTDWAAVKPLITSLGDLLGVPMSSLVKDAETLMHPFLPQANATYKQSRTVAGATQELYDAIAAGDTQKAAQLRAEMKAGQNGRDPMSDKQIDEKLADALALNDDRIRQMWEMRQSGRTTGLLALKKSVMADGWTDEEVTRAVNQYDNVVKSNAKKLYKQAVEAGDEARAEKYAAELRSVGMSDEDIAKLTAEKDTDEQLQGGKLFDNKSLFASIRNGSATEAEIMDIRDYLAANSTAKDPMSSIRSSLTGEFKQEYIDLVTSGKTKQADQLKARLIAAGASAKTIDEWVPAAQKAEAKDALIQYIDSGNAARAEAEIERILDEGVMDKSSIVTRLNNEYRQRYIDLMLAGKEREADELIEMLQGLGLKRRDGTNYYRVAVFKEWLTKYEKENEN